MDAPLNSPWLTSAAGGEYLSRNKRFILREVKAGRMKGARLTGRGEILVRREWLDEYVEEHMVPVVVGRMGGSRR